jgi:hypothetical protein
VSSLRYLGLLAILPSGVLAGLVVDWRVGLVSVVAILALLALQASRLGVSLGALMANLGRAYRALPRLLWSWDHAAAAAASREGSAAVASVLGVRFFSDLPSREARELQEVVRQTHANLAALFPGSRAADRVLLFARQSDMLRYLSGWFGTVGSRAAGFCFATGPVRVVGAVDAFRELGRDPRALLAHELVHGGLRGASRGLAMRPWLNEGLAEALAVSWFEPARIPGIRRFLRRARAAGHWLDWEELEAVRPGHVVAWLKSGEPAQLMRAQLLYSQACLLVLALLEREKGPRPCLRALLKKPGEAPAIMRQRLGFDGGELLAWLAREVDDAPLALTPWDRSRRSVLRALLDQDEPSSFQASALLGLAACGDAEDRPLLEAFTRDGEGELAVQAELALSLLGTDPEDQNA